MNRRYLISIIIFLNSLVMALPAAAWARRLVFEGLTKEDQSAVQKKVPKAFGDNPNYYEVDRAIRAIMSLGRFENVRAVEQANGDVKIMAKSLRLIKGISVSGNTVIATRQIERIIGLSEDEKFDRRRVIQAGEKLKELYGEKGYFNTIIEVNFLTAEDNHLHLDFVIKENKPCTITRVTIQTENETLQRRLHQRIDGYIGDPLTNNTLEKMKDRMQAYLADRRYLRSELSEPSINYNSDKTEAWLNLHVSNPYRYQVLINGNKFLSRLEVYQTINLEESDNARIDPISEIKDRLKSRYFEQGFAHVEVNHRLQDLSNSYIKRLSLDITEGPRVRLKKIDITGRASRSSKYYEEFIRKNSSTLVQQGYYNLDHIERGYKNLVTELRNQGFLKARVQSARVEFESDQSEAIVRLNMDEGPLTQIRHVTFEGAKAFSPFELTEVVQLQSNSPLRLNQLEQSLEKLKQFYRQHGYLEMKIMNEDESLVDYNDKGTQANINFKIHEGPKVIVKSIVIKGNEFTNEDVFIREISIQKGDVLTPEAIDESVTRLNKLGIFSRVNIRTEDEGTNISERTLVISVNEREPGILKFGVGFTNERDFTLRGFTGVTYSNLWGTARAVSLRGEVLSNVAEIKYPEHKITLGYMEPFLFGTRNRGRVNFTRSVIVYNYDEETASRPALTTIHESDKVDFLLERDLTQHTKLTWTVWSLDSRNSFERYGLCTEPDRIGQTCPSNRQQIAVIGPRFDIDFRDNPFLPSTGSYTRLDLAYSSPEIGSSDLIHFFKSEAAYTYYWRLGSPNLIWANSVRGGYLANLSDRPGSGVPTNHAFFLGGLATIRGYGGTSDYERIPPQYELPVNPNNQLLIESDSHYYLFKSELRFPLFGDHGGVLFYDGGAVLVTGYDFERPYRQSVGIGYRYNTPLGPVSLDLGFKINPREDLGEDPWRIHFSIGTF